jgi:hypothetical protein
MDEISEPVERGEAPHGHEGMAGPENTDGAEMDMDIQIRDDVETGQQMNVTRRGEIGNVDDPLSEDKNL